MSTPRNTASPSRTNAPTPHRFCEEEVEAQLRNLPGLQRTGPTSLQISVGTASFPDAVRLVNLVAHAAEAMNHHPDIDIRWRTVIFTLSTHSVGGLTQLDFDLAQQIRTAVHEVAGTFLELAPKLTPVGSDRPNPLT